jgi:cytochrome c peroxidase
VSDDSPFDRFVSAVRAGDASGGGHLVGAAVRGLKLFVGKANCRLCHSGPNFTDGEFHNTGVPPRSGDLPHDSGRFGGVQRLKLDEFNSAGHFSDDYEGSIASRTRSLANGADNWGRFKTPSLRNVALTGPYMHEGRFKTLTEVLEFYSTLEGAVQLDHHREQVLKPLGLTAGEISDLEAFLRSLTDADLPAELLQAPKAGKQPGGELGRNLNGGGDCAFGPGGGRHGSQPCGTLLVVAGGLSVSSEKRA